MSKAQRLKVGANFPHAYDPAEPLPDNLQAYIEEFEKLVAEYENPDLDEDSRHESLSPVIKHVFACAGIAMHDAQVFEISLIVLLLGRARVTGHSGFKNISLADLEGALDGMTCGQLKAEVARLIELNDNATGLLNYALDARNKIAHGFFYRHASNFLNSAGRRFMVEELVEFMRRFRLANDLIDAASYSILEIAGVSRDQLQAAIEETFRMPKQM